MKEQIRAALQAFATGTLAHNALHLFETLGYRTSRRFALGQPTYAGFAADFPGAADQLNHDRAYVGHWESIDLLFQLTAEEMRETNPLFQPTVERAEPLSYLFFCIGLKGRDEETGSKPYSRAELSQIARELNQPFPMPCLILFKHDGCLTLAVIDRRPDKRNESRDVLEKVMKLQGKWPKY